jgi:hypothetical protein
MMNKKDEAIKKCLRVLNPIANERMYETQWVDSAIHAAYEALEEKEWQGLTDWEIIDSIDVDCQPDKAICGSTKGIIKLARAIERKLKEKNE